MPTEIGNLTNLTILNLRHNQFTGVIPSEIGNLTNLNTLDLRYNQFDGEIPSEIGNLVNLIYLKLRDNHFTGVIPVSICDLDILWDVNNFFDISENQFCPPYPFCIEFYIGEQDTTNCD